MQLPGGRRFAAARVPTAEALDYALRVLYELGGGPRAGVAAAAAVKGGRDGGGGSSSGRSAPSAAGAGSERGAAAAAAAPGPLSHGRESEGGGDDDGCEPRQPAAKRLRTQDAQDVRGGGPPELLGTSGWGAEGERGFGDGLLLPPHLQPLLGRSRGAAAQTPPAFPPPPPLPLVSPLDVPLQLGSRKRR